MSVVCSLTVLSVDYRVSTRLISDNYTVFQNNGTLFRLTIAKSNVDWF